MKKPCLLKCKIIISIWGFLSLSLFMFRILADNANNTLSANNAAKVTDFFNRWSNFHNQKERKGKMLELFFAEHDTSF